MASYLDYDGLSTLVAQIKANFLGIGDKAVSATSADSAATVGSETVGSSSVPVYLEKGVVTECGYELTSVYRYKGSVDSYSALPTDAEVGDVYNIASADADNDIVAGDNVVWTGTEWDKLAGTVDLSEYVTQSELAAEITAITSDEISALFA